MVRAQAENWSNCIFIAITFEILVQNHQKLYCPTALGMIFPKIRVSPKFYLLTSLRRQLIDFINFITILKIRGPAAHLLDTITSRFSTELSSSFLRTSVIVCCRSGRSLLFWVRRLLLCGRSLLF